MEPGDVAENVNGGLSHMSEAKVTRLEVYIETNFGSKKIFLLIYMM